MRFLLLCLLVMFPRISFSQESVQAAKPSGIFDQVLTISYRISQFNRDTKKYDKQMEHIREIGYRIVSQTNDARPFTFQFIKDPSVNAFAMPNGFIFITEGMLKLGLNDEEWAQLLGHEITHVVNNHYARSQNFSFKNLGIQLATIASVFYATYQMAKNDSNQYTNDSIEKRNAEYRNLFTVAYYGPAIANALFSLKYSREFEKEADQSGRKFAAAAGYDPKGAESLFNKLSKSDHHHIDHMWRSHPEMLDRSFAASLSEEKKIEKDFTADVKKAKEQAQGTLLQYASYYSSRKMVKHSNYTEKEMHQVLSHSLIILHLVKLITDIDKTSPMAPKALQIAFEQLLILQAYSKSWPSWGLFYQLYKDVDPLNKNSAFLEEQAKIQYKELTDALREDRAGIPICLALIKNFPDHPDAFLIQFSLVKAFYQNRSYEEIPENFIRACEISHNEAEKKELIKFGKRFLKVCKNPYQLYCMAESLGDLEFKEDAKKVYLKMIDKCEILKEVIKIVEQESLSNLFADKAAIKENAIKKTFTKAKLKEKQNLKSEAYQYYNEILLYGENSPYVALAEAALKTLAFE